MNQPLIDRVEVYKIELPMHKPFRIALGTTFKAENILVRIFTSDGLVGIGEGSPTSNITGETPDICFHAAKTYGQFLVGKDPYAIESLVREFGFLVKNSSAQCAVDMALYDLLARRANLPLYALLGGPKRTIITDNTTGIDEPEIMAQNAIEIKNQGFQAVKVKLGTNRRDDLIRIQAIRNAIGYEIPVRLDANQGWDTVTAGLILADLAAFNIQYCEQPVAFWDFDAMKRIRASSQIPIMADESLFDHHDAFKLASMGACDYFNIKLAKSGGIHTALKINSVAEAAGIQCMVGSMFETRLGLTAAAHFASARPNVKFADLDSALMQTVDPVIGGMIMNGCEITLPDAPGLGADFDPSFLAQQQSITFSA